MPHHSLFRPSQPQVTQRDDPDPIKSSQKSKAMSTTILEWTPSIPEPTFSKAFLALLRAHPSVITPETTAFGAPSVPAVLPKMPKVRSAIGHLPALSSESAASSSNSDSAASDGATISVTIKSLRAPHKFTAVVAVAGSETVYRLKTELLKSTALPASVADARIVPADIKLLKKGKVVSDSKTVGEAAEGDASLSLVAMVAAEGTGVAPAPAPVVETPSAEESKDVVMTTENGNKDDISEAVWDAIASVVSSRVGAAQASAVVTRLKRGWELTAPVDESPVDDLD